MSDLLGSQDIFCPQILAVSGEKRVFQHPQAISRTTIGSLTPPSGESDRERNAVCLRINGRLL